eukprot:TRINITY_DN447_c0_g2_i3.p1 TRINITY_DN447_c0_g2~~TRINITY_DN447_c0_g2_i3.p1  ORF type:complete len:431 (-),score=144.37 TRINITY_DN447_c0_g2_i3:72-1364(-)
MEDNKITFKVHFKDQIRRLTLTRPTFADFLDCLCEILGHEFNAELKVTYTDTDGDKITVNSEVEWQSALNEFKGQKITRIQLEENKGVSFLNSVPTSMGFYTNQDSDLNNFENSKLDTLETSVPRLLEKHFVGKKIIPANIPDWLRGAVKPVVLQEDLVDLDINLPSLFDAFHQEALACLELGKFARARDLFLDALVLFPKHPSAWYNLACAHSLMGQPAPAVSALEHAIENGFSNLKHIKTDSDLDSIRNEPGFVKVVAILEKAEEQQTTKAAEEEARRKALQPEKLPRKRPEERFEEEAAARKAAEEEARRKVEEAAARKAAEEARRKAEEAAARKASEEARRKAEEEAAAKRQAEDAARNAAQEQAKKVAEEAARRRDEEAKAALAQKWVQVVPQLQAMGLEPTLEQLRMLDSVNGSLINFFEILYQ